MGLGRLRGIKKPHENKAVTRDFIYRLDEIRRLNYVTIVQLRRAPVERWGILISYKDDEGFNRRAPMNIERKVVTKISATKGKVSYKVREFNTLGAAIRLCSIAPGGGLHCIVHIESLNYSEYSEVRFDINTGIQHVN